MAAGLQGAFQGALSLSAAVAVPGLRSDADLDEGSPARRRRKDGIAGTRDISRVNPQPLPPGLGVIAAAPMDDEAFQAQLMSLITNSVQQTVLELIPAMVGNAVAVTVQAQIAPLATEVSANRAEMEALRMQNTEMLAQIGQISSKLSAMATSSSEAVGFHAPVPPPAQLSWSTRPGVIFVGGFEKETARPIIVEAIKELISTWSLKCEILSIWSPGKRWSSGRIQVPSETLLTKFLDWLSSLPAHAKMIRLSNGKTVELWAAREKAPAKRAKDAATSKITKILAERLQSLSGYDPAQLETCYLSRTIYYGSLKLAFCELAASGQESWKCTTWSTIGGDEQLRIEVQRSIDRAATAFAE
jgi:hypothetical protein